MLNLKGVRRVDEEKVEQRELTTEAVEVREKDDGTKTVSGYAVKWEKKSEVLGFFRRFREQFKKGAFADSLKNDDQRFLWSHDVSQVLGRTKNKTLRLTEDNVGLRFELDLPNTTLGKDTYESIKRGDVDGVSFGFRMKKQEWDESDEDNIVRTISEARLFEVSAVAFPAYPDSEVSARGHDPVKERMEKSAAIEKRKKLILETYL
nr:HK97 family phage prohead protease [Halobacillus aidingensis]